LFLIVGADVDLSSWKRVEVIQQLATLVVVNRPDHDFPDLGWGWRVERVVIPGLDVSSTEIRRRVRAGEPVKYLIPDAAIRVIAERRLYR
jgi:nicotinate-nucleotide adenylyltransferase